MYLVVSQVRELERENFRLRVLLTSARNQAAQAVSRAEVAERALETMASVGAGGGVDGTRDLLRAWDWGRWGLSVLVLGFAWWAGSGATVAGLVPVLALAVIFPRSRT